MKKFTLFLATLALSLVSTSSFAQDEEIKGTQLTISAGGGCTIPLPDDAVRVCKFSGQWNSVSIVPNNFDSEVYKDLTVEFKEPLSFHYNTPYKDAAGTQQWGGAAQGSTSFTLDFSTIGSITDLFIQNTVAEASSFAVKKAVATKLDGTTEKLGLSAGWGATIDVENCVLKDGVISLTSQWGGVNVDATNILNLTDKNLVLRLYANEPIPSTLQWCVKFADDDSNAWPQLGISENNNKYAECTIDRPLSSIFLQWTSTEAGVLDLKAITYEIVDKQAPVDTTATDTTATDTTVTETPVDTVVVVPNAADTLASAAIATIPSLENLLTEATTIVFGDDSTAVELAEGTIISAIKGEKEIGIASGEDIKVEGNKITINFKAVPVLGENARAREGEEAVAEDTVIISIKATDLKINGINPTADVAIALAKAEEPEPVEPAKPEIAKLDAGDYFLYNVEAKAWLGGANLWGTQASVVAHPQRFTIAANTDGTYTLDSHTYNSVDKHFLGDNYYVDSPAANWTINVVEGGVALTVDGAKYLATDSTTVLTTVEDINAAAATWKIYSYADMIKALEDGTATDATFVIKAANFSRNLYGAKGSETAWTVSEDCTNKNLNGGANDNMCAESFHSTFNISQVITGVPNGKYTLKAQGFYRQDGEDTENMPVVYANDSTSVLPVKTGEENSMSDASASFTSGLYAIEPIEFVVTDSTITLGVKNQNLTLWCIWDNFELTRTGDLDPEPEPVDPALIEIAQTQSPDCGDGAERATIVEGEGFTQYTTTANISVIVKILDVDVKGCDSIVIKFAEPIPSEILASFAPKGSTANFPLTEGITEYKIALNDSNCDVHDGVLSQITLLTLWKNEKVVKIAGIYKHMTEEGLTSVESVETENAPVAKKVMVNGKVVIVKGNDAYELNGQIFRPQVHL